MVLLDSKTASSLIWIVPFISVSPNETKSDPIPFSISKKPYLQQSLYGQVYPAGLLNGPGIQKS